MVNDQRQSEFNRLTALQARDERTAGGLLTSVCHEVRALDRQRLLSLAFWYAGRAAAYEDEARAVGEAAANRARGPRR
jgi:hypothetical protein